MDVDGGVPRRLGDTPSVVRWSRDGKWIYYSVQLGQAHQLWKMPVSEGAAQAVRIPETGTRPTESPDGKFLYYIKPGAPGELWRMLTSGAERQLVAVPVSDNFVPVTDGVYYTPKVGTKSTVEYWSAVTGRNSTVASPGMALQWGITVSPDRQSLLYVQTEHWSQDLMLIEPFR
jgi:Tol biopolymer transport system component